MRTLIAVLALGLAATASSQESADRSSSLHMSVGLTTADSIDHSPAVLGEFEPFEADAASIERTAARMQTPPAYAPAPPAASMGRGPSGPGAGVTTGSADGTPVSFKKLNATYTMVGTADSNLGLDVFDLQGTLYAPAFSKFTITPGFGGLYTSNPDTIDIPDQLYSARLQFAYRDQINLQLGYEVAITPSFLSDFNNTGSDAFRLPARALAFIAMSYELQFALGVVYLDRDDIPLLPAVGMIYAPSKDLRYELIFPRPRVITKLMSDSRSELWGYVAGELGGGTWAVERLSGADDELNYRDFRLVVGAEQKYNDGLTAVVEAGYVFGREVEYESGIGDFSPDSSFLFSVGLRR